MSLSKYLNKTEKELNELSERWERWDRLSTWNKKPRKTEEDINEFYINMPDGYMNSIEKIAQQEKENYLRGITAFDGMRVLDFGCGTGVYGLELLRQGAIVDFYDLPTRAFEFLKWRVAEEGLKANFYNSIDELGQAYDVIICVDVLENMKFASETFMMLHGKLKMFGKLVLDSPLVRMAFERDIKPEALIDGEHIEDAVKGWIANHVNEFLIFKYVINEKHFIKTDLRIFMIYNYTPGTTGDFIERALKKYAHVFTTRGLKAQIGANGENIKALCEAVKANCILQVDSGGWVRMPRTKILKACYSIDTFTAPDKIKSDILYPYDVKMYAQKRFAQEKNEYWVPLAADPEMYKPIHCLLKYDVAFCGTFIVRRSQAARNKCLKALTNEFAKGEINLYVGRDYNEQAALRYNESTFVFNMGICNDVNMRMFEAAACGVPQFYNEVDGLEELGFKPDVHYIKFTDDSDITKKMFLVLNDDKINKDVAGHGPMEKAKDIANAAYNLVLKNHTYDHRARQMVKIIMENMK